MTDKHSEELLKQAEDLEKSMADLSKQINDIIADVAKRCPDAVILIPVEVVSGTKGDER